MDIPLDWILLIGWIAIFATGNVAQLPSYEASKAMERKKYVSDTFGKKAIVLCYFFYFFYNQGSMCMYFVIFKNRTLK